MSKLCCMPTAVGATESTGYCDLFWTYVPEGYIGFRGRLAGGDLGYGTSAGASACAADGAVALSYRSVSAPLCFFEADPVVA
jgi:hypothetical protein